MDTYQLTRSAQLESLAQFRDFIRQSAQGHPGIDADAIYDLQLAVEEACTNIIEHGYAGMDPGSIILNFEIVENHVRVVITDFGHPFEPSSAPTPDIYAPLEERQMGGFGLFIIYQTMDDVNYETDISCNRLILTKNL